MEPDGDVMKSEHRSLADELTLLDVDALGVRVGAPDPAGPVFLLWEELRQEAQSRLPSASLFRDLLLRAEAWGCAA